MCPSGMVRHALRMVGSFVLIVRSDEFHSVGMGLRSEIVVERDE